MNCFPEIWKKMNYLLWHLTIYLSDILHGKWNMSSSTWSLIVITLYWTQPIKCLSYQITESMSLIVESILTVFLLLIIAQFQQLHGWRLMATFLARHGCGNLRLCWRYPTYSWMMQAFMSAELKTHVGKIPSVDNYKYTVSVLSKEWCSKSQDPNWKCKLLWTKYCFLDTKNKI